MIGQFSGSRLMTLGHLLVEPIAEVRDLEQRRLSKLLASLLLVVGVMLIPLCALPELFGSNPDSAHGQLAIGVGTTAFIVVAYGLSRRGRYQAASQLLIVCATVFVFGLSLFEGGELALRNFYYLIAMVCFSSIFLSIRTTTAIFVGFILALMSLAPLMKGLRFEDILFGPLTFNLVATPVILLLRYYQESLSAEQQAQLLKSERRLSLLVQQSPLAIVEMDLGLNITLWNPAAERLLGYSAEEALGRYAGFSARQDDRREVRQVIDTVVTRGVSLTHTNENVTKDGRIITCTWYNLPLVDERGKTVGFAAIAQDVTERQRGEDALRESEARYRDLFEASPVSLWVEDFRDAKAYLDSLRAQGVQDFRAYYDTHPEVAEEYLRRLKVLNINQATLSLYQAESKEEVYAILMRCDLPEHRQMVREIANAIFEGKRDFEVEGTAITRRDQRIHIQLRWSVPPDSRDLSRVIVSISNLTERRHMELALRESEARYRIVSELISDYAYSLRVEADGTPEHEWLTEDSYLRVTGYRQEEIDRKGKLALYHPDDAERAEREVARVIQGQAQSGEYRIITKSGEVRWLHIHRRPVWDEAAGRVVRIYGVAQDITERKRLEQDLLLTQLCVDRASIGIMRTGSEARIQSANQYYCDLAGYTTEELSTMHISDIDPTFPLERWKDHRVLLRQEGADTFETIHRRKDGSIFPVEITSTYVSFYGDEFAFSFIRDITERKRAADALRESEERYRIVSGLISDYAYSYAVHPDGTYTHEWTTESFVHATGYQPEEIGNSLNLYHPDDLDSVARDVQATLTGEAVSGEYRIITKSGEERWLTIHRHPVWDETGSRVIRFYGVAQDITERKRAADALRESEERYRIVSELISDYAYSYLVHPDGTYTHEWTTESYFSVTGYHPDEAGNTFTPYHPDDLDAVFRDVETTIAGETTRGEYRIITQSGEERWLTIHRHPVWDETGSRVIRFYGVAQDITERKRTEAERLRLSLEQERLALMTRFVEAITHDFHTSLTNIETSRYLIGRLQAESDQKALQPKLDNIRDNVIHLTEQIRNLRTVSSLMTTQTEHCDLNALAEVLTAEQSSHAGEKGLTLTFQPYERLPLVLGDSDGLKRALRHLVMNALNHTPPGGTITLRTYLSDDHIALEVSDTGEGIASNHLPHIFDPFFRSDPARATVSGGVGLGLTIVKMVTEAHRGWVSVDSTPGVGSVFTMWLPVAALPESS